MTDTTGVLDLPNLADPATFHPGVPFDAFERLRATPASSGILQKRAPRPAGSGWCRNMPRSPKFGKNPSHFSSAPGPAYPLANLSGDSPMSKHILFMDPPEHSRVRRAAARPFGPRVVANFETWIRDVVVETLDDAFAKKEFDWVTEVAGLIPACVIAAVMGVPRDKRNYIVEASDEIFIRQTLDGEWVRFGQAFMAVGNFVVELGKEKLLDPRDDMVTVLAKVHEASEIDLIEYGLYTASLVVAGFETTHTMIGQIAMLLATDDAIRHSADRAIESNETGALVDEFLCYLPPAVTFMRTATQDVDFHGQLIKKDDAVMLLFAFANRDPEAYEDPNTFDPARTQKPPSPGTGMAGLAFSIGPHRCIGHSLAKLELRILLEEMHSRGVRLELTGAAQRGHSLLINRMLSLPVRTSVS